MRFWILFFTSGAYSGYIPFASGTFGTLVAVALYLPMAAWNRPLAAGGDPWLYALVVMAVTALAVFGSDYAEGVYKKKDSGKIVIDEIVGFFFAMFLVPTTWFWIAAAFFAFRFFDVLKPPPIDALQKLRGGLGVVIDDVIAGVYTCLALHLARLAYNWLNI